MKWFHDEVFRRFPELREDPWWGNDEEASYALMKWAVLWLSQRAPSEFTPELVSRVVDFGEWCRAQPRGETAEDDVFTIWCVGFIEELFRYETTRPLLPHFVPREKMIEEAEYFEQWVGPTNYQLALKEY